MSDKTKLTKTDAGAGIDPVASEAENAALDHTEGGVTTRDDRNDLGVPMLPGSSDEPVGPEDALGEGPTRGDYTGRVGPESYHPHESVLIDDPEPDGARWESVPQRPRTAEIGDVPGKKGGVQTRAGN